MQEGLVRNTVTKKGVARLLIVAGAAFHVACSGANGALDPGDGGASGIPGPQGVNLPARGDAGEPKSDAATGPVPPDASVSDAGTLGSDGAPDGTTAATPDASTPPAPDASPPAVVDASVPIARGPGHVMFRLPDNDWHMIAATSGASAVDVSAALNGVSTGKDNGASLALDGAFVALDTTRLGCVSGDCLAVASAGGTQAKLVRIAGAEVPVHARPAVAPGGLAAVYPASGGPHASDLYAVRDVGGAWTAPTLLTAASSYPSHHDVAFSFDGKRVVFDCAPSDYQAPGGAICEAAIDGSLFRKVVAATDLAGSTSANEVHHPGYAPDGSVVFEADWNGTEAVWRIAVPGAIPTRISPAAVSDDNSPCVLPDGRIASLWLGRPGNTTNLHELKVMNADGSGELMLVTGQDIVDVGTSCGR
jgi:hypothetical protein